MEQDQIISLIVDIGVAIGTFLLAYYAYQNIRFTRTQLKLFQDQTKVFISQNQPVLRSDSPSFRNNTLSISLKNLGVQPAFDIGIATICLSVKKIQTKENAEWLYNFGFPDVKKEDIKDYFDFVNQQKIIVVDKILLNPSIEVNLQPINGITYLKRENGEATLSQSDGATVLKCDPFFMYDNDFQNSKKIVLDEGLTAEKLTALSQNNYQSRRYNFNELKEVLKNNKIQYVYLTFALFCKDSLENVIFQNEIASCIVDINMDDSIEDAELKPRSMVRLAMPHPKLVRVVGSTPMWMYAHEKWKPQNFEDYNRDY